MMSKILKITALIIISSLLGLLLHQEPVSPENNNENTIYKRIANSNGKQNVCKSKNANVAKKVKDADHEVYAILIQPAASVDSSNFIRWASPKSINPIYKYTVWSKSTFS
jgi:hypothetical protein